MPLSAGLIVNATLDDSEATAGANGSVTDRLRLPLSLAFADGTGGLAAQVQYNDIRTLGVTGSEDLDLAGGLTNRKNRAVTLAKLKGLVVRAPATNAGDITLRTSIANGMAALLSGDLVLPPGTVQAIATEDADGWAVTPGTGDLIRVLGAEDDTYEIALWGEGSEA